MARQFFGTDGIRGRVNEHPLTAEAALRLAIAAARAAPPQDSPEVIIGRDTRSSGAMFEAALVSGFSAMGLQPVLLGVAPTPAVALHTRLRRARLGIMVSASHNPAEDNGFKLFSTAGIKLTDAEEEAIEQAMAGAFSGAFAAPRQIAMPRALTDGGDIYVAHCLDTLGNAGDISRLRVVADCAHGAASQLAPQALRQLGVALTVIGASPDGQNINAGAGAMAADTLMAAVRDEGADIGLAFDGDADRLVAVDENGDLVDGDQLMALIASDLHSRGRLKGGGMVSTVMSNMGLERHLAGLGLTLARTPVGDRHVGACMRQDGFNFGGEPSGHIIFSDVSTTGDGLLAAMHLLSVLAASGRKASDLLNVFEPYPQELVSIRFSGPDPLQSARVQDAIRDAESRLGQEGRVIVRKSGTEPVIRIMAEAPEAGAVKAAILLVQAAIEAHTG
jgi:phosphoglucosamine mutase